jgi:hypothetical protein
MSCVSLVERLEQTPAVKDAVARGEAVIACAYQGFLPGEIESQLPEGFEARSWAAIIENGKIVRLVPGAPESVVPRLLAPAPTVSP